MNLQLRHREKEGVRILDLEGHLIEGPPVGSLREAIVALADAKTLNVILNFARVTKVDAEGAEALFFSHAQVSTSGGALKLLNLSPQHVAPTELTKLEVMFEVFTDEEDAINSFFPDRAVHHYDILEFVEEAEQDAEQDKDEK